MFKKGGFQMSSKDSDIDAMVKHFWGKIDNKTKFGLVLEVMNYLYDGSEKATSTFSVPRSALTVGEGQFREHKHIKKNRFDTHIIKLGIIRFLKSFELSVRKRDIQKASSDKKKISLEVDCKSIKESNPELKALPELAHYIYVLGVSNGENIGHKKGFNEGYAEGKTVGYTNGAAKGRSEDLAAKVKRYYSNGSAPVENKYPSRYTNNRSYNEEYMLRMGVGATIGP